MKDKIRRWLDTAGVVYAVLVGPFALAYPIIQSLGRWEAWESITWCVLVALAVVLWIRDRDRRR